MNELKYIENKLTQVELNELNAAVDQFTFDNNVSIEDIELVHDAFIKGYVIAHKSRNIKQNGVNGK